MVMSLWPSFLAHPVYIYVYLTPSRSWRHQSRDFVRRLLGKLRLDSRDIYALQSMIIIPAKARDYVFTSVGLSVCLFVCLFVCYHDN